VTAPPTTFVRHATADDLDELVSLARRSFFDAYSETDDHVYDISNLRRLGRSEKDLVQDMYDGIKAMIEKEKSL
jgi:creatine kinase/arginine kinase